jgi:hypothetical protein
LKEKRKKRRKKEEKINQWNVGGESGIEEISVKISAQSKKAAIISRKAENVERKLTCENIWLKAGLLVWRRK